MAHNSVSHMLMLVSCLQFSNLMPFYIGLSIRGLFVVFYALNADIYILFLNG